MLLQQLFLAGDIAAVALGKHVLAHGLDGLAGNYLAADGSLYGHLEKLAGNILLELFAKLSGSAVGLLPVGNEAECIHLIAVQEHIHLYKVGNLVKAELIVQGGITLGAGLESIKKVIYYLVEGHLVVQLHKAGVKILHILVLAAPVLTEGHDIAHKLIGRNDGDFHIGLIGLGNGDGVGVVMGIVHHDLGTIGLDDLVDNGGQGGDKLQVKLPLKALLNYLHMEHTEEAAAEAKAQCNRAFRLIGKRSIVELELVQSFTEVGVLGAVLGVDTAVDHGSCGAVAGQGLSGGIRSAGNGVAHVCVLNVLDGSGEVTNLAGAKLITGLKADGS